LPQKLCAKRGFSQVLWLTEDYITEAGTMNLFGYWRNQKNEVELITCPLNGTILPGVTRQSVLDLARQWNEFNVIERPWKIGELIQAVKEKRILELFGAGTAATIAPIEGFEYDDKFYAVPCGEGVGGHLTLRLHQTITDIQYGVIESPWSQIIGNRSIKNVQ